MIFARSLLFLAFLVLTVLAYSVPILALGRILPYLALCRIARSWSRLVLWGLKGICGLEYRVKGLERLPSGRFIVLCKHQSAWETIALRAVLPLEQTWVLKQELMRVPFFGWALAAFDPIAIDRSAGRKAVRRLLDEGRRWLDAGRTVVVFPEGTRVPPGSRRPYGIGGALIAERTGRPVVPMAHNAGIFWGRREIAKRPGTIELVIGPIIDSTGRKAEEINKLAEEWIEATVAELPGASGRAVALRAL